MQSAFFVKNGGVHTSLYALRANWHDFKLMYLGIHVEKNNFFTSTKRPQPLLYDSYNFEFQKYKNIFAMYSSLIRGFSIILFSFLEQIFNIF